MLLILHLLHERKVQHSLKLHLSLDLKLKLLINYIQKIVLKELSVAAVQTIERMDEEIELKDKIKILAKELKDIIHYNEQKIQNLLNKVL
jgi:hypothetical protein